MSALLLVRYGELALKSPPVRREFERTLSRNILELFAAESTPCRIRADHGHLYVEADDGERATAILRRVFGVTSVSVVHETTSDRAAIAEAVVPLARPVLTAGASFAVRARRTGQHPYSSQELAGELGGRLLAALPELRLKVDLTHPDVEVFVEVRGPRAFIYFGRASGPGGLPLGVAGRLVALVDGPRGALGAWLMMKRGCRCRFVASADGVPLVDDVLRRFDPRSEPAPPVPDEGPEAPMREIAEAWGADGLVLPLTVDEYPTARAAWGDRVVFSPTVGLTGEEVEERWRGVVALASP